MGINRTLSVERLLPELVSFVPRSQALSQVCLLILRISTTRHAVYPGKARWQVVKHHWRRLGSRSDCLLPAVLRSSWVNSWPQSRTTMVGTLTVLPCDQPSSTGPPMFLRCREVEYASIGSCCDFAWGQLRLVHHCSTHEMQKSCRRVVMVMIEDAGEVARRRSLGW